MFIDENGKKVPVRSRKNHKITSKEFYVNHGTSTRPKTFAPIEQLPFETLHQIAGYMGDRSLFNLMGASKTLYNHLTNDYIWLQRFLLKFDEPKARLNRAQLTAAAKTMYTQRMAPLANEDIDTFEWPDQVHSSGTFLFLVQLLLSLIAGKFMNRHQIKNSCSKESQPIQVPGAIPVCKNFDLIQMVLQKTHLAAKTPLGFSLPMNPISTSCSAALHKVTGAKMSRGVIVRTQTCTEDQFEEYEEQVKTFHIFQAMLLVLSPHFLMTEPKVGRHERYRGTALGALAQSQYFAYAPACRQRIVKMDGEINFDWVLHLINFFRTHALLMNGNLRNHWSLLQPTEKPQMWKRPLGNPSSQNLGRIWKSTYSYLERTDIEALRNADRSKLPKDRPRFTDHNLDNKHPIQTLRLWVPEDGEPSVHLPSWESVFSGWHHKHFQSNTYVFNGIGFDDEDFYCVGHITPLAPQRGIPGWSRMTMIKYFKGPDGSIDDSIVWAYEGIILPGDQIIVGRWWAPEGVPAGNDYSGPFLMWAVDEAWKPEDREVSFSMLCLISADGCIQEATHRDLMPSGYLDRQH
jgi:hypothetical protein